MIEKILKREDVIRFITEITTEEVYLNKDIPNKINGEKVTKAEYPVCIFIDAIIKYCILIGDIELFDNYLEQLRKVIKKVETHNDIQMGVIKLLIKYASHKLNLSDIDSEEKKIKLIKYFYDKFITEGYLYHSFPSIYKSDILNNGLSPYNRVEGLEEIDNILSKYKIEGIFSKELEKTTSISVTDSLFMAYYYAISSPNHLKKLCINLDSDNKKIDEAAYMLKDYNKCRKNILEVIKKKEIKEKDRLKLLDFFDKEWNRLDISNAIPVVALIKRSDINKNSLPNYDDIIEKANSIDISVSIRKIFESIYNDLEININIPSDKLHIIEFPDIKVLCKKEEKEPKKIEANTDLASVRNETGNATVVALLGVLLITLGVTIMIIMLGK